MSVGFAPPQGLVSGEGNHLNSFFQRGTSVLEVWYSSLVGNLSATTLAYTVDTLYAYPIVLSTSGVIDRIAFRVNSVGAAGSVARLGLYKATSRTNIYPGDLVVDGGEIDTEVGTGVKSATVSEVITPGLYWIAYLSGVAAATLDRYSGTGGIGIYGITAALNAPNWGVQVAQAYAALPDPFTTGGTLSTTPPFYFGVRFES